MVNAKTANNKRKSFGGAGGKSPKLTKLETSIQTPGKGNANATPGKQNKSPKNVNQQNNAKSPQQKTPKGTPFKNQKQASGKKPGQNAPKTPKQTPSKEQQELEKKTEQNILKLTPTKEDSGTKNKRSSESESEGSPPKKVKMFGGTSGLQKSQGPKNKKDKGQKQEVQNVKKDKQDGQKKRKGQFSNIKEMITSGDKTSAIPELDKKLKLMEERNQLTKTGKRKLKMLIKLRNSLTEEKVQSKHLIDEKKEVKKPIAKKAAQKKVAQKKVEKAEEDEESSAGSDYEVEAEVKPGKVGETGEEESDEEGEEVEEEESGDEVEGEESGEDEEDSDEEEAEDEEEVGKLVKIQKGKKSNAPQSGTPNLEVLKANKPTDSKKSRYVVFVGNIPYDATTEEITEHFNKVGEIKDVRIPIDINSNKPRGFSYVEFKDEITFQKAFSMHHTFIKDRRINVLYTQGGQKKGSEKKNEVKAKNFKFQAMRNKGQLAGSVKQNQKRSFRRGPKKEVNGS